MATATGSSDGGGKKYTRAQRVKGGHNAAISKAARRRSGTPSYSYRGGSSALPFSPGGGDLPF